MPDDHLLVGFIEWVRTEVCTQSVCSHCLFEIKLQPNKRKKKNLLNVLFNKIHSIYSN